ncbi:hypothetical protein HAV15_009144 [Penicillium sp. str. |nr:hypothetical protein HAV15_009144 [Penicillium sp. str. \
MACPTSERLDICFVGPDFAVKLAAVWVAPLEVLDEKRGEERVGNLTALKLLTAEGGNKKKRERKLFVAASPDK